MNEYSELARALTAAGLVKPALGTPASAPAPVCQYCGNLAELVTGAVIYPRREDLHAKRFWRCAPCRAYVGCHDPGNGYGDGTWPLGVLANAELREAKKAVHAVFDPLWRSGRMSRKRAYRWLAERMQLSVEDCHVGQFSVEQCRRAEAVCRSYPLD